MISKLIKKIDSDTIFKISGIKPPTMAVINTDNSKDNEWYLSSIIKKGKELGIDVVQDLNSKSFRGILILKPYEVELIGGLYDLLKEEYHGIDLEPIGQGQVPTIKAISRVVEEIGEHLNVLIINRSQELGLPLAENLIKSDHTVTIAHSNSRSLPVDSVDVVIAATGRNIDEDLFNSIPASTKVIDVSGDFSKYKNSDNYIGGVGRLTTSYLFNELVKL